jgi:hypothetical protein
MNPPADIFSASANGFPPFLDRMNPSAGFFLPFVNGRSKTEFLYSCQITAVVRERTTFSNLPAASCAIPGEATGRSSK